MKNRRAILVLLAFSGYSSANPLADLTSPDQAVRDKAAAELHKAFQDTPETKWTPIVEKLTKGQSKTNVLELLRPFDVRAAGEGSCAGGGSYSESYRLDNEWLLVCWFQNVGNTLIDRQLTRSMKHVWTAPPKDYTGKWIVYFVNGQKSHEIDYRNGQYVGEFISYRPDGTKCVVQHYTETGANGDDTGYNPSGKVTYRGRYKDGKQIGTWTWYDEEGNVTSTQEHPEP